MIKSPKSFPTGLLALVFVALVLRCAPVMGSDEWTVADADARVPLAVEGDLFARNPAQLAVVLDFNALLDHRRALAADSLTLVDAATGAPVPVALAQDAEIRYASGNPILRLEWGAGALPPFAKAEWHLYFRTVERGAVEAWQALASTFVETPSDILLDAGFERADPHYSDRPAFMQPGGKDVEGETTERVWTTEDAHTGKYSLKIARAFRDGPRKNSNRPFWWTWPPVIAVRPGQNMRVSAWLKTAHVEPGSVAHVMVEFRDAERRRIPGANLRLNGKPHAHDWMPVSGAVTAPPGAAGAVLWFSLSGAGKVYCDDLTVTLAAGSDLPPLAVAAGNLQTRAAYNTACNERPAGKVLACAATQQAPILDGALDDACWEHAGIISDFEPFQQVPGSKAKTTVFACADRDALYFAFECAEPDTADLRAAATQRDSPVWEDDSIELFLDTNLDLRTYYQIIINSKGVIFDQDKGRPGLAGAKWDGPITAAARVYSDRWIAEMKIEFAGVRLAETAGRNWGANFARTSLRGGRSLYAWAPVQNNFGEPHRFGLIVLPFDPSANVVGGRPLAAGRVFLGQGMLPFEVVNRRAQAVNLHACVTELAESGNRILGALDIAAPPNSMEKISIPVNFAQPGAIKVRYDLIEVETGKPLYRGVLAHAVPPALEIQPFHQVSYLSDDHLDVAWTTGLARDALDGVRLALIVVPASGGNFLATGELKLDSPAGTYKLRVKGVPAGRHDLRARLLRDTATLGEAVCRIDRITGPFTACRAQNQ